MEEILNDRLHNSVYGGLLDSQEVPSLGRLSDGLQVEADRQPATAKHKLRREWKKKTLKIATWNVRTMYQKGKLDNVLQEMERMDIDIMGIAEMRWNDSGRIRKDGHTIIYSGNKNHSNGVGIIINRRLNERIIGYWPISDRVLLVKMKNLHRNLSFIQGYAPTSDATDENVEQFYEDLNTARRKCKGNEIPIIMGDFNAKVGSMAVEKAVGKFGLGQRNERGTTLVEWCVEHKLCIANTCFEKHGRKLWTWKSPNEHTRNQIDFIIIPQNFRTAILDVNTYASADCNSDHNPVVAKFRLRLQRKKAKRKGKVKFDWISCQKDDDIKKQFQEKFLEQANQLKDRKNNIATTTEDDYKNLKDAIINATEALPILNEGTHAKWMTREILEMMEKRRLCKHNKEEYDLRNKQIKKKIQEEYEKYLNQHCELIEKMYNINPREAHRNIRMITKKRNYASKSGCLRSKTGEILMEEEEILKRWSEYIAELFDDPDRTFKPFSFSEPMSGPSILKSEIKHALEKSKDNKANGPDEISTEMLKMLDEIGLDLIHQLFNKIYDSGKLPEDMLKSEFIALPKKPGATECENHRTISLMSHLTKLLLRILTNRMKKRIHFEIAEEQYGFMPDKGTRNAVFVLKNLAQRSIEMQKDLYLVFIDYKKAFDRVKHTHLLEMLDNIGIDDKELRLVQNLYFDQLAAIRVNEVTSKWTPIKKGVRQGCVMSPDLFSLYSEIILRAIEDVPGVRIGGKNLNNLRYADDTVLIADTEEKLQELVDIVNETSKLYGMELNEKKTEAMVITKKKEVDLPTCKIKVNGSCLKQVKNFKYLGTTITWNLKDDKELSIRTAQAKAAFNDMRSILCNNNITMKTRLRVLNNYIFPIFTYNSETWTLNKREIEKINAFEMWTLRRMLRISYTARKTNEEVLKKANHERRLMRSIKTRAMNFLGHVIRKGKLEHLTLSGKINGRRARGKQRTTYLTQYNQKPNVILQTACNRNMWKILSKKAINV